MSERLFGTDGVRGIPGHYPLTRGVIRDIARISAELLSRRVPVNGGPPTVLMGRDPRGSGPAICRSLVEGFQAAGCRTLDLGVVPTPAISYLTPRLKSACGVMVSASHNPAEFNGVKFFTADGYKMSASLEDQIEARLKEMPAEPRRSARRAVKPSLKTVAAGKDLAGYVEFLRSTYPATSDLSGLRLVIDCGNGASSKIAPDLFRGLGADVTAIGCAPNGRNINQGFGALDTASMQKAVVRRKAHAGISFDGDADRVIFADEKGKILNGDYLICFSALRLRDQGELMNRGVVLTVMSNFGLLRFLSDQGIMVETVPVGDRNVTEAMERLGYSLGGEASGHIIFKGLLPTGDGMLTAVQTLAALRASGRPMSAVRRLYASVPQIIKNLKVARKVPLAQLPRVRASIRKYEKVLKGKGRVFVRYSGTEPLLRIMLEGPDRTGLERMAKDLAQVYLKETVQEKNPVE